MGKMRTLDFNPAHVKDDPARTADYGYFHHERDIEPETVSEAEAARMIAQAVANETAAYGYLPDDLVDSILNFGHQEMRDLFLAALFPGAYPNQTDATRRRILSACESIANEYEGESWSR